MLATDFFHVDCAVTLRRLEHSGRAFTTGLGVWCSLSSLIRSLANAGLVTCATPVVAAASSSSWLYQDGP
jgi:hypothetical protein